MDKQATEGRWHYPRVLRLFLVLASAIPMAPAAAQPPDYTTAQYVAYGIMYFTQSRMRDAERSFLLALRKSPDDRDAWTGLLDIYTAQLRHEEGIDTAEKALQQHPDDPEFLIRKGAFLRDAGYRAEARAALERAVEVSQSDPAVLKRAKNNLYFDRDASGRINLGKGN